MVKRSRVKRLPNAWEDTAWIVTSILPGGMINIGTATKDEMEGYRREKGTRSDYVKSGIWTPSYASMNDEALNYYLYWRENVRRGRFLRTDMGYIRLFVSELITFNEDPKNDLALMTRLVDEYKDLNILQIGTIGDACICHAILNKLPLPEASILKRDELKAFQTYEALRSDRIGYISTRNLMDLFHIEADIDDDIPYDALLRRIIAEIVRDIGKDADTYRLADTLSTSKRVIPVYDGLVYHGNRKSFNIAYPNNLVTGTVGYILRRSLEVMLCGCGAMLPHDMDSTDDRVTMIASDVVQRYRDKDIRLESKVFSLDPELVDESHRDLEAVTRMMRVDDEESPGDEPTVVESTRVNITGWEGLSISLSDTMRRYISSALEGDAKRFLKDNGLRMSSVEKEINTLAMDMTGDIIVEDGTVIDDYLDEVREMIGC